MTDSMLMNDETAEPEASPDPVGDLLGRFMGDCASGATMLLTALGLRLGLWTALAEGPGSVDEIGARAGVATPYAGEWLRSQAAAGYVAYDASTQTFSAAAPVAIVFDGPLTGLVAGTLAQMRVWWEELDRYEDAFRTGSGIRWGDLPAGHAEGMDLITRAVVVPSLLADWLPSIDGLVDRLRVGASVADVGCGFGGPTVAMADAFASSTFSGIDADDASIARARQAALSAGVSDRVGFEVAAAGDLAGGPFDLITFIDSLHDFGDPAGALRAARANLADGGHVVLVEHAGSADLEENLHPVGQFFYAASALVCTPNALADRRPGDGAAIRPLGCIAGEDALRRVAAAAGFGRVERLDVDAPLNLILDLTA